LPENLVLRIDADYVVEDADMGICPPAALGDGAGVQHLGAEGGDLVALSRLSQL
jgi:hypothetical protein